MTTVADWLDSDDAPEHLDSFERERAPKVPDPYNPDAWVEDWTDPETIPLRGAWVASSSSVGSDPVREQLTTRKQLVIFDPDADVVEGDRIRPAAGGLYTVTGLPEFDKNPFTGWQPTRVLNVEEVTG